MRRRNRADEFAIRWGDLSRYNTERLRGLLHTPEMVEAMAKKQALYDKMLKLGLDLARDPIPEGTDP